MDAFFGYNGWEEELNTDLTEHQNNTKPDIMHSHMLHVSTKKTPKQICYSPNKDIHLSATALLTTIRSKQDTLKSKQLEGIGLTPKQGKKCPSVSLPVKNS